MNYFAKNVKVIALSTVVVLAAAVLVLPNLTEASGSVELRVKKSGPSSANAGETLTYNVAIKNVGNVKAKGRLVNDNFALEPGYGLPEGVKIVSKPAACTIDNHPVKPLHMTCEVNLLPGEAHLWTFQYSIPASKNCGALLDNHAITSGLTPESSAHVYTRVKCAAIPTPTPTAGKGHVVITKTGPSTVHAGDTFSYHVTVKNTSNVHVKGNNLIADNFGIPGPAYDIPEGAQMVSKPSACEDTNHPEKELHVRCDIDLAPGQSHNWTFTYSVPANKNCGLVPHNHIISSNLDSTSEARVVTKIECGDDDKDENDDDKDAGIKVTKTDNHDVTRPGHTLTYVITVKNTGEVDLHDVKVTDKVPGQLEIVNISNDGSRSGNTVTWEGLDIEAGEKKTLELTVRVKGNVGHNTLIINDAKACSEDHDVCDESASDATRVERHPQVAGVVTHPVISVPVTARTGAGAIGLVSLVLGGSGLAFVNRRFL